MDAQDDKDEEMCVPEGFLVISVAATQHQGRKLKAVELAVADQSATLRDLAKQYRRKFKEIKKETIGLGLKKMEKIERINESMTLEELLEKLQRRNLEGVQFYALFGEFFQLQSASDFTMYPQFQAATPDNQPKPCLSFTQLHRAFYLTFSKLNSFQLVLKGILMKLKQSVEGAQVRLNGQLIDVKMLMRSFKDKDLIEVKVKKPLKAAVEYHSQLMVQLPYSDSQILPLSIKEPMEKLQAELKKQELEVVSVGKQEVNSRNILVVAYQEYREWKVETLLTHRCGLSALNCGLKIAGKLLRPSDLLSTVDNEMKQAGNRTIEALLLPESYFFVRACEEWRGSFSFEQVKSVKQEEIKRVDDTAKERSIKIEQQTNCDALQWLRFIVAYTSTYFFKELNRFLRTTSYAAATPSPNLWQSKFAYKLAESLLKLPNHCGTVFRGVDFVDSCQPGQVIHYKSFLSTSIEIKRALKFCGDVGHGGTFYVIGSLTGRNIQKYSFYNEQEVLFPPCCYFLVLSVHQREDFRLVSMIELPLPRITNSNLLYFWLNDSASKFNSDFNSCMNQLRRQAFSMTTQVLPFASYQHLVHTLPLVRFHSLEKNWVTAISNIGHDRAGIKNIRVLREIYPSIKMCLFVGQLDKAEIVLKEEKLARSEELVLAQDRELVIDFMRNCSLEQREFKKSAECQLIWSLLLILMQATYQRHKQALVREILAHHQRLRQRKHQQQQEEGASEQDQVEAVEENSDERSNDGREFLQKQLREQRQQAQQQREMQMSKLTVSAGVVEVKVEPTRKKEWKEGIIAFKQHLQINDEQKLRKEIEEESKKPEKPRPRKNNQQNAIFTGSLENAFRKRTQHSPDLEESQHSLSYSQQEIKLQTDQKQKQMPKKTAVKETNGKENKQLMNQHLMDKSKVNHSEQDNQQMEEELPIMRLLKDKISSIQSANPPAKDVSMRVELSDASWSSLSIEKVNPATIAKVNSLVSQATKTVQINLAAHSLRKIFGDCDSVKPQSAAPRPMEMDDIGFGGSSHPSTVQKAGEQSESKSDVLLHLQEMGSSVLFGRQHNEEDELRLSELADLSDSSHAISLSKLPSCGSSEPKRIQRIDIQLDSSLGGELTLEKGESELDISELQDYDSDHEPPQQLAAVQEEDMEESRRGSRDLEYSGSLSVQEEKRIISGVKQGIDRLKSRIESSFTSSKSHIDFDELEREHKNVNFRKNIEQLKQRMEKDARIGLP